MSAEKADFRPRPCGRVRNFLMCEKYTMSVFFMPVDTITNNLAALVNLRHVWPWVKCIQVVCLNASILTEYMAQSFHHHECDRVVDMAGLQVRHQIGQLVERAEEDETVRSLTVVMAACAMKRTHACNGVEEEMRISHRNLDALALE